jgi:hypothetical protein
MRKPSKLLNKDQKAEVSPSASPRINLQQKLTSVVAADLIVIS